MNKERRWLKSAIVASAAPVPAMPWQRDARHRPESMKVAAPKHTAIAAR